MLCEIWTPYAQKMKVIFSSSLNFLSAYPNFEPLHENTVIFLRAKISIAVT
jgi:hypothetical protein